jgi:hypothetical protein
MRSWRVAVDAVTVLGLIVLFSVALERGWHWHFWRTPVIALAVALFLWTMERYPEGRWVHGLLIGLRALIVLTACWAEFHLPR